jgi:hypothetical protein
MSLKTDYVDEILREGEQRKYNLMNDNGVALYSNVRLEKAYTPKQYGTKFSAEDVNSITKSINDMMAKIKEIEKNKEWKLVGYVEGREKTINVDVSNWNECMITVGLKGDDTSNKRVLVSTVVPKNLFAIGYVFQTEGRHQAFYSDTYRGGLDFISSNQLRLFASSSSLVRLYYR